MTKMTKEQRARAENGRVAFLKPLRTTATHLMFLREVFKIIERSLAKNDNETVLEALNEAIKRNDLVLEGFEGFVKYIVEIDFSKS